MLIPSFLPSRAFVAAVAGLVALPGAFFAQDLTPPKVAKPLPDLSVAAGTTQSVIGLKNTFGLDSVTGQIVRMETVVGNIDIEMLSTETPKNVANFLAYVNSGAYNKSFVHRSIPGFVEQGGGYSLNSAGQPVMVVAHAPVAGEHVRSNTRGTLALALSNGPNSGTSEWFFNLADNTMLDDTSDGGPFTVFGRVIEADLATLDAMAKLPTQDLGDGSASDVFTNVPLYNYSAAKGFSPSNLVYLNHVAVIPLVATATGGSSVLTLKVKNSNPALVKATITGRKLKLAYHSRKSGAATIKVIATDTAGTSVKTHFTVTVK